MGICTSRRNDCRKRKSMRLNQYARQLRLIPMPLPVLTPVRGNLTSEEYLAMTDAEFDAYLDAQYGDDDD